jgi:hypothetical protein
MKFPGFFEFDVRVRAPRGKAWQLGLKPAFLQLRRSGRIVKQFRFLPTGPSCTKKAVERARAWAYGHTKQKKLNPHEVACIEALRIMGPAS